MNKKPFFFPFSFFKFLSNLFLFFAYFFLIINILSSSRGIIFIKEILISIPLNLITFSLFLYISHHFDIASKWLGLFKKKSLKKSIYNLWKAELMIFIIFLIFPFLSLFFYENDLLISEKIFNYGINIMIIASILISFYLLIASYFEASSKALLLFGSNLKSIKPKKYKMTKQVKLLTIFNIHRALKFLFLSLLVSVLSIFIKDIYILLSCSIFLFCLFAYLYNKIYSIKNLKEKVNSTWQKK